MPKPKEKKKRTPQTVIEAIQIPFTLQEAAEIGVLGVSALRKRCQRGEAGYKIGKTWVIPKEDAYRLQNEGARAAGRPVLSKENMPQNSTVPKIFIDKLIK